MKFSESEVIERLCAQVKSIAEAAALAVDDGAPIAAVYDAIEDCMAVDCGVASMACVYDAILVAAKAARTERKSAQKRSEDVAQVYFIRRADGLVKIGYSHDPAARLSQLKQQHQCEMELLATTSGARAAERELHERFSAHRATGEWFRPADVLMQHIAGIRSRTTVNDSLQFH